jgi:hypothetical protein
MKGEVSNSGTEIRTVKVGNCRSLSGKSTIGYEIGVGPAESIHLRVVRNSGPGAFARKWVALDAIKQALRNAKPGEVTSANIASLFDGGQNTSGFAFAALHHEKLVRRSTVKRRCYEVCGGDEVFNATVKAWLAAGSKADESMPLAAHAKSPRVSRKPPLAKAGASAVIVAPSIGKDASPSEGAKSTKERSPSNAKPKTRKPAAAKRK